MAAPVRTQKDKPAPVVSAPKPRVAAAGPAASAPSRLSPMVAAAIMAGAERTARVHPQVPGRKPAGVHTTPPARVSDTPPTPGVAAVAAGSVKLAKPAAPVATLPRPAVSPVPASPAANAPAGAAAPAAATPKRGRAAAAAPAAESAGAASEGEAKPVPANEAKAGKGGADAKGTGKGEGKGDARAADKDKPADEAEDGGAGGGPAVAMKMPPPPSGPSRKTMQRIGGVARRAGGTAGAMAALPPGAEQAGDARKAVDQPSEETRAKAKADLIAALGSTPAPSPEIVALCDRIYKIIEKKRPVDEDALMEAEPAAEAKNAGDQLNETVEGETKKAQAAYGAIDKPPEGAAPAAGAPCPASPIRPRRSRSTPPPRRPTRCRRPTCRSTPTPRLARRRSPTPAWKRQPPSWCRRGRWRTRAAPRASSTRRRRKTRPRSWRSSRKRWPRPRAIWWRCSSRPSPR